MSSNRQLFLIDSSVWVAYLRRDADTAVLTKMRALLRERAAATVGLVALEVMGGARNEKEYDELREDFLMLHWLTVTTTTWFAAARDVYDLRRKGITAPFNDVLIARAALDAGCVVLHRDRHYPLVAKVTGVKTEAV